MSNSDREIRRMRRFLGVPRALYPSISDDTVAQLGTLVLAVLILLGTLWPTAIPLMVVSVLVRLEWVLRTSS